MQSDLGSILIFLALGALVIFAILTVARLVRPRTPDPEKASIYECGERPVRQAWFNFNPRFYIIAIVFLIFDVEIAFTFPVAVVFPRWVARGAGAFAFVEIALFVGILALALAYVWAKGDLEWLKELKEVNQLKTAAAPPAPRLPEADASTSDGAKESIS
jgi:NADH-quinone oxidoreductase subunit A